MKAVIFAASLVSAMMLGTLHAQIYADIKVSHPGIPTGSGTFRVRLDYDKAPRTCANFIGLATGQRAWLDTTTGRVVTGGKYYDGLTFHRLDHSFVLQGGDPRGNGTGGPGYVFQDEFDPSLRHANKYIVSMANSGVCTNGSQFFITLVSNHPAAASLDDKHSVFGEVVDDSILAGSRALIDGFTSTTNFPTTGTTPNTPITIDSVTFSGPDYAGFDVNAASLLLPTVNGVKVDVAYNSGTDEYTQTFNRKKQGEYFMQHSDNLQDWEFLKSDDSESAVDLPYFMSMNAETSFSYTTPDVIGPKYFSRMVEIDYSLMPRAPDDMLGAGKVFTVPMGSSETVQITFDGAGGGTWSYSGGGSGSLTTLLWARHLGQSTGFESYQVSRGRSLPVGRLGIVFDVPVGTEKWTTLNFYNLNATTNWYINFHTPTSGWCEGAIVYQAPGPGGIGTIEDARFARIPFTYTP